MRHTFETMGTVASLSLEGPTEPALIAQVEQVFAEYDCTFSLYRADSPLSSIARGGLRLEDAPELVRAEYERAVVWRSATFGWFEPHRPDGVLDLSGTVKAAAIEAAGRVLTNAGAIGILGVGGDLLAIGDTAQRVGVADPADRTRLLADVALRRRRAIATSGSAERGDHVWSRSGRTDVLQASVLADDIVTADVIATTIVAAGTTGMDQVLGAFDVDALVVTEAGLHATHGWPKAVGFAPGSGTQLAPR